MQIADKSFKIINEKRKVAETFAPLVTLKVYMDDGASFFTLIKRYVSHILASCSRYDGRRTHWRLVLLTEELPNVS